MATKLMVIFLVLGLCNIVSLATEEESELLNTLDESQPGWKLLNDEKEYNLAEVYKLLEKQLEHGADSKANELVEKLLDLNEVIPSKCSLDGLVNVANLLEGNYWRSAKSNSLKDYAFVRANEQFKLCEPFLRRDFDGRLKKLSRKTKKLCQRLVGHLLGATLPHHEFLIADLKRDKKKYNTFPLKYYQSLDHLKDRPDVIDMTGAALLHDLLHGLAQWSLQHYLSPDYFWQKFNRHIVKPCTVLMKQFAGIAPLYSHFMIPGTVAYNDVYHWETKIALDFCETIPERNRTSFKLYKKLYG